jgi:hypothetical protein
VSEKSAGPDVLIGSGSSSVNVVRAHLAPWGEETDFSSNFSDSSFLSFVRACRTANVGLNEGTGPVDIRWASDPG